MSVIDRLCTEAAPSASLSARVLATCEGFAVHDVRCTACCGPWSEIEEATRHGLVLTRRGVFHRRTNGRETLVDPTVIYFRAPGEEQQIAHPIDGGDVCTSITLDERTLASVWGGEPTQLPDLVFSTAALDLSHRLLVVACEGTDEFAVGELGHRVLVETLRQHDPTRVESGRPTTAARRRGLVSDVRERLACEPTLTLGQLARELVMSPHHLSRVFSAATGVSMTRYRNRLRVRMALERIAAGERSLARLAAELGFADHAHLTRTVKAETGCTPTAFRAVLVSKEASSAALEKDGLGSRHPDYVKAVRALAFRTDEPATPQLGSSGSTT